MCGVVGFAGPIDAQAEKTLDRMMRTLHHRGPDDAGQWLDRDAGIALGHRRLSILDLSPGGHQPMTSSCGRFVMVYNGEIYNHLELRAELERSESIPWRGHSDTEVVLEAVRQWGWDEMLRRVVGMFAIALWDRRERCLYLTRDRLGEKPLYYGWMGSVFLFGSELAALRAHPDCYAEVDRNALSLLLRHNYIPAPYSIFKNVRKLEPGTHLCLDAASRAARRWPEVKTYWSAREIVEAGIEKPYPGDERAALDDLDAVLRQSIQGQMLADVPVGAFLSGGIDSSLVVALMQSLSAKPVKTFTIGFHEAQYNEAEHAKAVARHLGTEHTELYVTPQDALNVIPTLSRVYSEPFSDSSQVPTCLISALARHDVTVCLSGDGGDELFGGYNRYFWGRALWRKVGWLPRPARATMAAGLRMLRPETWDRIYKSLAFALPASIRYKSAGDKLHKLAGILAVHDPDELYLGLISHWEAPDDVVLGATEPPTRVTDRSGWPRLGNFTERMMFLDTVSYLPDDILVKVDRASMSVSLESRIPLLDHRVLELAWRLPLDLKVRGGQGKYLLRRLLYRYVPASLIERPKMGFGVPIDSWLRGPLREWAEDLLDERRLREQGYFDAGRVRAKLAQHQRGERNWQYHLWDILMFQAWLDEHATPTH